jgi:rare lipoprotein A (peptidoglycan hydrolase)
VNIAVTVALVPALFTGGGGEEPSVTTVLISAPVTSVPLPPPTTAATVPPTTAPPTTVPPTTVATAPPATAHTHVTSHSHPEATSTSAAPRPKPTTTTTAPPQPEPKQAPPPAEEGSSESGRATWYELEGARAGICAHKTLPFGTIVTVTNTNTGKSIQCEVGDRGPFVDGYIIDLFRTDFEQLAPTSSGWFPAKITW